MPVVWFLVAGALLIGFVLVSSFLKRLPATGSMLYVAVGALLGPWGAGLVRLDAVEDARLLERLTELAVIVSLFTAGLKLRLPLSDRRWRIAILLAAVAMVLTIGGIATVRVAVIGLPFGAAVLLGAVLAPTDPVLASDVQVEHEHDAEPLRFSLTGEAGLNDGTAFPFVMLGLGLVGVHELGANGWRWLAIDLVWAVAAGLAIGTICGAGVAHLVLHLRRAQRETEGLDEFLALGLIALSYGFALLVGAYGFLAVFAAGLSVRRIEREDAAVAPPSDVEHAERIGEREAADAETAPAHMANAVLDFNERLERLGELAIVIVVGALLAEIESLGPGLATAFFLFVVIRPLSTTLTLVRSPPERSAACVGRLVRRARRGLDLLPHTRDRARPRRPFGAGRRGRHTGRRDGVDPAPRGLGDADHGGVFRTAQTAGGRPLTGPGGGRLFEPLHDETARALRTSVDHGR